MNRKLLLLGLVLVCSVGVATASEIPELEVAPGHVNWTDGNNTSDSVAANRNHTEHFTFTNTHENKTIYNVTLEDRDWIRWNESGFDINASSSVTVPANISRPVPGYFNETITVPYQYNNTVGNESELTFDKNYYPEIRFDIETFWIQTSMDAEFFDTEFTLDLGESGSSVFKLENIGSETAYNVSLDGNYLSYEREGFNVSLDENEFVSFQVKIPEPEENPQNATNRTYNTSVNISGENFQAASFPVQVHVPFKNYTEPEQEPDRGELGSVFEEFETWCRNNPESCNVTEVVEKEVVKYRNRTVYRENLTEEELESLQQLAKWKTEEDVTQERVDLAINYLRSVNQSVFNRTGKAIDESREAQQVANQVETMIEEWEKKQAEQQEKTRQQGFLFLMAFVFLLALIGVGAIIRRYAKSRNDWRLID